MTPPFDLTKFRASLLLQGQIGHLSEGEREALALTEVDQDGLSEDALGQQLFCQAMQGRRDWIAVHCNHAHCVERVRDDRLRLTGRRFSFADKDEAFAFKMQFQ